MVKRTFSVQVFSESLATGTVSVSTAVGSAVESVSSLGTPTFRKSAPTSSHKLFKAMARPFQSLNLGSPALEPWFPHPKVCNAAVQYRQIQPCSFNPILKARLVLLGVKPRPRDNRCSLNLAEQSLSPALGSHPRPLTQLELRRPG